jgi:Cu+-exporting ATPase
MSDVTSQRQVELDISGMTSASCAARVEQRLSRVDGAQATVNFATEKASIDFDSDVLSPNDLIAAIRAAGYDARAVRAVTDTGAPQHDDELDALWWRLWISAVLALPVAVVSMVPSLQFVGWRWWCLAFASPVVLWGAWPFHLAAWRNARHATATMDTLISFGTSAAFGWSLYALVFGRAATQHTYLEVAAAVPVFLLGGRYCELQPKRRAGAAIRSLLGLVPDQVHLIERPRYPSTCFGSAIAFRYDRASRWRPTE